MSTANPYASPVPVAQPSVAAATGLASRIERFLGAVIDAAILLPVNLVLGMGVGVAIAIALNEAPSLLVQLLASAVGGLLGAGVFLLVNGYLLATRGQTVGKVVMKTKIVRDNGEDLPLSELVLMRYVPLWATALIPYVGGLLGIVNALAIFRENHKCIHDDIAGTKVIKLS